MEECERVISNAKEKRQPNVDEVLIAPTMVANQLWTLVAEEQGCREGMYILQKGLMRGRISGSDFVKQMRGLGRECFLKMVLARKCARGMGLETRGR
jgi:ESCRT-I complex subunit TSG101